MDSHDHKKLWIPSSSRVLQSSHLPQGSRLGGTYSRYIICIFYIVLYKIHSETSGGLCNFTIYLEWLKFVYWENIYLVDPTTSKVNPTCSLHCRLSRSQWYCITNSPIKIFQVILISILITNLLTIFFCWKPLKFNHCKCFKNLADLFLSWETQ